MKKVAICLPTYKRSEMLSRSIQLILDQTFRDFDLFICNDASPDKTREVVNSFTDERIHYIENQINLGIPKTLNKLFSASQSEYVITFHNHDEYQPDFLEKTVFFLDTHPEVIRVFTGVRIINQAGGVIAEHAPNHPQILSGEKTLKKILNSWRLDCFVLTVYVLIRRSVLDKNPFDEQLGFDCDQDLSLRLCLKGDIGYIREPLVSFREREDSHPLVLDRKKPLFSNEKLFLINTERYYKKKCFQYYLALMWLRVRCILKRIKMDMRLWYKRI